MFVLLLRMRLQSVDSTSTPSTTCSGDSKSEDACTATQLARRPAQKKGRMLAPWLTASLVVLLLAAGCGIEKSCGDLVPRPLTKSVHLVGESLYGVAVSSDGAARGEPFERPLRVESGRFRWYDRLNEGDALLAQGLAREALRAYENVLGMDELPRAHMGAVLLAASRALAVEHRVREARRLVREALSLADAAEQQRRELELAQHEDEAEPADSVARRRRRDASATLWFHLGLYASMCGEWAEAERAYTTALAVDPSHSDALNHLGLLKLFAGDIEGFSYRFGDFVKRRLRLGAQRQQYIFNKVVSPQYRSTFRTRLLAEDAAEWFVNHAMLSLDLYGAPSLLQLTALQGMQVPKGYRVGELEANLVLFYRAYCAAEVRQSSGEAHVYDEFGTFSGVAESPPAGASSAVSSSGSSGGGGGGGSSSSGSVSAVIDLELVHFNLAKRLSALGAWEEAARHFEHAAMIGSADRAALFFFRAALQHPRVLTASEASGGHGALRAHERLARALALSRAAASDSRAELAARLFNCLALSTDLLDARSSALLPLDATFLRATEEVCGGPALLSGLGARGISGARITVSSSGGGGGGGGDCSKPLHVAVVSASFCNTTSGRLLAPVLAALGAASFKVTTFSWALRGGVEYPIEPASINLLLQPGRAPNLTAWREAIRAHGPDVVLLVDPHLDLRLFLLAQTSRLAARQVVLLLDGYHERIAAAEGAVDEVVRLVPPGGAPGVWSALAHTLLSSLAKDLVEAESMPRSPRVQGQIFLSDERYYCVAGGVQALHPDFDAVLARVQKLDPRAVIVMFVVGGDARSAQDLWRRLERSPGLDPGRVKLLERMPRHDYLAAIRNFDVMLEPFPHAGAAVSPVTLLEALYLRVPVVGWRGSEAGTSARGDGAPADAPPSSSSVICPALGIAADCLVDSGEEMAVRATALADSLSAQNSAYRQNLQAIAARHASVLPSARIALTKHWRVWLKDDQHECQA